MPPFTLTIESAMYADGLMNFLMPPQGSAGIPPATSGSAMTAPMAPAVSPAAPPPMPAPGAPAAPLAPKPYAPVTAALGLSGANNPLGPIYQSLAPALSRFLPPQLQGGGPGGGLAAPPPLTPGGGAQPFKAPMMG